MYVTDARTSQRLSTFWFGSGRSSCSSDEAEQLAEAGDLGAELAVELVATDPRQVVATALEEGVAEVGLGRLDRRRLTGAGPLVDLDQRLVLRRREVALLVPLTLRGSRSG